MKLIEYLPNDYTRSGATKELLAALEKMWEKAQEDTEDFENQLFLSKATWGLNLWEQMYGIATDESKGYDIRRSVVRAKIRGAGTTTVEMIKNTSEAYVNGEVAVVEHNSEHRFDVVMLSVIGIPQNMEDLRQTIEEIKPAHLDYEIIIRYNTWGMLAGRTWADIAGRTWQEVKEVEF